MLAWNFGNACGWVSEANGWHIAQAIPVLESAAFICFAVAASPWNKRSPFLTCSPGITIGRAHLVSSARLEVAHYEVPQARIEAEVARFDAAVGKVREELEEVAKQIPADAPAEFGAFVDLHQMILNDPSLAKLPKQIIRERRSNAEWALIQQMESLVGQFDQIDDPYLKERKADITQVVERVLKALLGRPGTVAPDLTGLLLPHANGTGARAWPPITPVPVAVAVNATVSPSFTNQLGGVTLTIVGGISCELFFIKIESFIS